MNTARTSRYVAAIAVDFATGVLVTLPAIMAAVASGGAGHGDFVAARALFPASMLLTLLQGDRIGVLSILIGLLQFPVYGTLLGWSIARKVYLPPIMLACAHIVAASACFAGTLPTFT